MLALFRRLWAGEESLARSFWEFSVAYGLALNILATIASMSVAAAGYSGWVALGVFLLPAPYALFALVAVWRSAARHPGSKLWADLARPASVAWTALVILI
jgi:hypothetical protein